MRALHWALLGGGVLAGLALFASYQEEAEGGIPQAQGEQSPRVLRWLPLIRTAVRRAGNVVPIPVVLATIDHESGGNENARGSSRDKQFPGMGGEFGLMQLMPSTAHGLEIPFFKAMDPATNIDGGVRLLTKLWKKYEGNLENVFSAYNRGTANPSKNRPYVNLSLSLYETYEGVS